MSEIKELENELKIDEHELAALRLEMVHPKNFKNFTANMSAKELRRVMYNLVFFPFHSMNLKSEKEKQLIKYNESILKDKQMIYIYQQERNETNENEGNENE